MSSKSLEPTIKLPKLDQQWVKELISECISQLREEIKTDLITMKSNLNKQKNDSSCSETMRVDDIIKRLDKIERRYKEDDKFTLTRAKLITFIEDNDIR